MDTITMTGDEYDSLRKQIETLSEWYANALNEAQALREEVAALRARVVVVQDGWAIVPRSVTNEMYNASGMVKDAPFRIWEKMFDAAPRLNAKSISAETLRRIDLVLAALRSHDFHGIINSTIGSNWREQVAEMRGELRKLLDEGKES